MQFSIIDALTLIGALGFFIYGMKIMSEGIQKAAGSKLREILGAMTRNRFFGVFTGFFITALVQSSSATTVMTVSFVNAGLLSLVESAGVMMGANIGTTITAWLVSILGFKVKIAAIALPIIAIGFPLMFSRKSKTKAFAEFLIGFALLFMGLDALKNSVPDLKNNPEILVWLSSFTDMGFLSTLMFIGIGTLITIILQSSSASMALTLVMCNNGWIPYEAAAAMVLGENIGTTITAELASLVANVHAKRSARIHTLFNLIGVSWMIFAMPLYLNAIDSILIGSNMASPFVSATSVPIALSYFHTAFNTSNVLILIWFVPFLVKLATKTVKSKGEFDEEFHLEYIGFGLSSTSELSIVEAKKEVIKFGKLTRKITALVPNLLTESDNKKFHKIMAKIKKYEEISDRIELEIANYLTKITEGELSEQSTLEVRGMMGIIGDLERVADICYQMSKIIERKVDNKIWFTPEQRENLKKMFALVEQAVLHMQENMKSPEHHKMMEKAKDLEQAINKYRNQLRKEYLSNVSKGSYNVQSGIIYNDIFSSLEKIGDHVINVNEALVIEQQMIKT